ncbi:MAG TPA: radical SAM protein [Dehalococcoidia bacterium]
MDKVQGKPAVNVTKLNLNEDFYDDDIYFLLNTFWPQLSFNVYEHSDNGQIYLVIEGGEDLVDSLKGNWEAFVSALAEEGSRDLLPEQGVAKQERFKRYAPLVVDKDAGLQFIPLNRLVGGALKVTPVDTTGIKHVQRPTAPSPRGWYKSKHVAKNIRPRPCYSEALLTTPYSGYCNVGCQFCYINFGTRGYKSTMLPTVNTDYPEQMDKQLAKMMVTGAAYMSSYTEAFQEPLESQYHITERLTRVFMKHNVPIFYLSRRIPPAWVEEALLANPYSYMQWSINTSNPEDLRRLSPGIFKIDELLKTIERFAALGIYTSFQVNPVLPGITTLEELLELVKILAGAGANHVIIKFVEISPSEKKLMIEKLRSAKLDGVDEFESVFTEHFGHQCYVRQDLRKAWLDEVLALTRQLNITMSTCYEYYNNGMSGASMGPWYVTSDQCHGPAVPVHYRPAPGERFIALPGCYRKGCLYCAETGTQSCRNETLLSAKALQYKDYREIRLDVIPLAEREKDWGMAESCPRPESANTRGKNPGLKTDAELWGLPLLEEVLRDPTLAHPLLGCGAGCSCTH